jgi:alpha-beta hydrolase superfamily lysophospholipase
VRRSRVLLVAIAAVLVCGGASSAVLAGTRAAGPTTNELTITVSDGTKLACGLVLPAGSPPAGGWPGLLLFHGLGQAHGFMERVAMAAFAPVGFASLACDARGTGASGGTFGLDGPTEVQDARNLFAWLAARPDVSDTKIGALGLSLGGGEVWNAAVAGVPFKAIVPAITWTNLGRALNPNGVVKVGEAETLAQDVPGAWESPLAQARDDLIGGAVTSAVKAAEAARSSRATLHALKVPTLILQGRHDFLFDLDQAITAYRLLAGPKRLYLGDLGHPPASNPQAEQIVYLTEVVGWFEHYVAGGPSLVGGGVELAHDPWDGRTTLYKGLPGMRPVSVNLTGSTKLPTRTVSVTRSVRLTGGPFETFGDGYVTVRYSGASTTWTRLVATVSVQGRNTPVTEGAAPVTKPSGLLRIPLMDEAVFLPRAKKLDVTLGAASKDGVYHAPAGTGSIKIGRITLKLSVLKRAVSR